MSEMIRIEDWAFAPDTGILQRGGETYRLEMRTAALLEYLSHHQGSLVSNADIIEHVWDGRTVSPNSVAVVISDIRRALGDDSRQPHYIETLPKRGYLLIADVDLPSVAVPQTTNNQRGLAQIHRRWGLPALIATAIVAALVAVLFPWGDPEPQFMTVFVALVENQTADTQYDPLIASVTELLAVELARHEIFQVSSDPSADVIVSGNLILWDGHPSMSVHAKSAAGGHVIWSGMASGPETRLPRQVRQEISELAETALGMASSDPGS